MNTLNERSEIKEDYELGERPPLGTIEPIKYYYMIICLTNIIITIIIVLKNKSCKSIIVFFSFVK